MIFIMAPFIKSNDRMKKTRPFFLMIEQDHTLKIAMF